MKHNVIRFFLTCILAIVLLIAGACNYTEIITGAVSFGAGLLTARQFPHVATEQTCYLNGVEVDCSAITIAE